MDADRDGGSSVGCGEDTAAREEPTRGEGHRPFRLSDWLCLDWGGSE